MNAPPVPRDGPVPDRLRAAGPRRTAHTLCLAAALLGRSASWLRALQADASPGENFDLSHWKLTLPDQAASEIEPAQLEAGFTNAYFHTGPDGAMVFWCPVTGGTTDGSEFPRSELRELLDPGNENVNWSGAGTNLLTAQCRILQVPSTRTVIIGQIHSFTGNAFPLVKLQFHDDQIEALVKESPADEEDTTLRFEEVELDEPIAYRLDLTDGRLAVTVNGTTRAIDIFQTDPAWRNQKFYFRAGAYCQDNDGDEEEGASVSFSALTIEHHIPTNAAPSIVLTNWNGADPEQFRVTLVGQTGGNYFIERSTDLSHWRLVLVTNSLSGRVEYAEARTPGVRYFRGGVVTAITIFNSAVHDDGRFGFTLVGPAGGNYFIQRSTNMIHWDYLMVTNVGSGRIDFKDTIEPGLHYYRGGAF